MFPIAWGVVATAFGWIIATDFRGAAHRFHAYSHAATPFSGAGEPPLGVGFLRMLAGVFALIGPVVLVSGLMDVWRGRAGPGDLPPAPAWFVVAEAAVVGAVLLRTWRRSGVLRREWDAGNVLGRTALAVLTASAVAFTVTLGFGWDMWMMASWLVGGLCGLILLSSGRPGTPPETGFTSADSSDS
ncbi:hypothetical protein [Streptomyces sp. NBC_00385]|uniref:hypothetical protein n=1 Tax=Streptomyces sp. NBC_00385 TaxID=2975733 RepID=UPI002DDA60D0|nr:hypothetical protein [Streptomyces sp. NBC_00385]WRZ06433.1 hypothetical protein OG959_25375 [Streptomyces sp. NBC_00385]